MIFPREQWADIVSIAVNKLNKIKNARLELIVEGLDGEFLDVYIYGPGQGQCKHSLHTNWFNSDIDKKSGNDFWLRKKLFDQELYSKLSDADKVVYKLSLYLWLWLNKKW